MIQRIATRLILENNGKPLLLRRSDGRSSILGKYELPGGRVFQDEQPEDSLKRYLKEDLGIESPIKLELTDVFTYRDGDDRDIQYAVILYKAVLLDVSRVIKLGAHHDKYVWYEGYKLGISDLTDLTKFILGVQTPELLHAKGARLPIVYSDGGSRGNPGASAAGFVLIDKQGNVVSQGSKFLGITTSDIAEYEGVKLGLIEALKQGWDAVECRIDSMLVVDQLNGKYQTKNDRIRLLYNEVTDIASRFDKVKFIHIPRELNSLADGLVNRCLDDSVITEL